MTRDWEQQFRDWGKPPPASEEERCERTISEIRTAIKSDHTLNRRNIDVFVQGSYKNGTNVKTESDVDTGSVCKDSFIIGFPPGVSGAAQQETFKISTGIIDASYHYSQYKNELGSALTSYFGRDYVKRGNKAFHINETRRRVDADVAPFFEYRRYTANREYHEGVALYTDKESKLIVNWPKQHYDNGCQKNSETGKRFKAITRCVKSLAIEMQGKRIPESNVPGFLIECLLWNVPSNLFNHENYSDDVKSCLLHCYHATKSDDTCKDWCEVSGMKWLFVGQDNWTRDQANKFVLSAWLYVGIWNNALLSRYKLNSDG